MSTRLFGTDGVRGIANGDLTCHLAFDLGRAGACVLSKNDKKPTFIVGKDTRISGDMLEAAIIAGICSAGADVIKVGVVPTPAVSYLTRYFKADAGIVISASHNPVEFNGIKFFNNEGYKLSDSIEDEIESLVKNSDACIKGPIGSDLGMTFNKDGKQPYINFTKEVADTSFNGLKVAIDCANGASYKVAPQALESLGADIFTIGNKPDGKNINVKCGSTHPELISDFVKKVGADVGLAFDGDADRLIAVDEKGDVVDGDHIMAICAMYLNKKGQLANKTVVSTVMSNMGLEVALKKQGIDMVRTKVGDRYVLEEMLKCGYNFGGEQSGHIIFSDYNTTGDGLVTAVNLLKVLVEYNKPLSEIKNVMQVYPQILINVKVKDKTKYSKNDKISSVIKEIEDILGNSGRVLVRPSGTEPLIRVMVEGEDESKIGGFAQNIASVIEKELGR